MAKISDENVYNPGPKFAVGSAFAPRKDPFTGKTRFHAGQDLRADIGTAVPSATDGIVRYSGYNSGLGHLVGVESVTGSGNKILVFYGHLTGKGMPAVGDPVRKGDVIGLSGDSGVRSTGPHLHVSIVTDPSIVGGFTPQKRGEFGFKITQQNSVDPLTFTDWGPSGVYHETSATPRELYLTDRFQKSPASAPLYESNRFVKSLKSAAAMVQRTPLFDSDAVDIGVQNPAGEIGVENPATDSFNERFPDENEFMPGRRNPGGTLRSRYAVEDRGRANVELPEVIRFGQQGARSRQYHADGNVVQQRFTPADGREIASEDDAGGKAQPWSWRDTVVDSQNRLIQPVDHVDWDRVGRGQAGVPTTPQYGADGRPAADPQQAAAAHLARVDEAKQRIPDFDQVIRAGGRVPIAPGVADEILNSEKSALLQYHLAGNPDKLDELNALSGTNLAREIGRLEGRLYLPPARTATEESPPLSDAQTSAAPMFDPHTTDDMDAFANWLREDQARRRPA